MGHPSVKNLSRRGFLKASAGAAGAAAIGSGLVVGLGPDGALAAGDYVANPFVRVGADGVVTVLAKHFEMGQGTSTGLATLVAEEIGADWSRVAVDFAPADSSTYANLLFGSQGTGGSTAIANSYEQYRQAGAQAALMLRRAAADAWGVSLNAVQTRNGALVEIGGDRRADFGEMAPKAAAIEFTTMEMPQLKDPSQFTLIGDPTLRRLDQKAKTDGSAVFSLDVRREGMIRAVITRPPRFGATLKSFDATEAKQVRGVLDVRATASGVVVYATTTWPAIKARELLQIEWDFSAAENRSSDEIMAAHKAALDEPGLVARNDGDVDAALPGAAKTISVDFEFPFLSHAPLEPMNCVVQLSGDRVKFWDACQFPGITQPMVAAALQIPPENVEVETVFAGGSFGRRATPTSDYHVEAALAAKALEGGELFGRPLQLVWTREDDIRGGYFRPVFAERIEAAVDEAGEPVAWRHAMAGKSILKGTFFEQFLVKDGIDATSIEGANDLPYAIPNMQVSIRNMETPVPVLWWRAVGHTHTAYSTEVAIDMLAEAAGRDPVAFRLALMKDHPRHAGVLRLAAEKAGWDQPAPEGRFRGVAMHKSFSSYVAHVVEVSKTEDGAIKLERVVCAVDCGVAINPDNIAAQMEGGAGYGLGAVMRDKITLFEGEVEQSNYWDYEPIRMSDMPEIEVHIVPSAEAPTGVGEPGLPPIGPALANAIFAATGERITALPMTDAGVSFA